MTIKPGRYRHYKGGEYFIWCEAQHSETCEPLLMYRCLYGDYTWWVRPEAMFSETVIVEGKEQCRFTFIAPMSFSEADIEASSVAATRA